MSDFVESKVDMAKVQKQQALLQQKAKPKVQEEVDDFFDVADVGQGTEFAAVKPWVGQIREPTGYNKKQLN